MRTVVACVVAAAACGGSTARPVADASLPIADTVDAPAPDAPVPDAPVPDAPVVPNVTTSADDRRTGWYPDQPGLAPAAVADPARFGKLFDTTVHGAIYAQPLVSGGVLVVATEDNEIDGLDAATGAVRWSRRVGEPWHAADLSCFDLAPNIGITGTPVIDIAGGTAYFFAKTYLDGAAAHQAHAVDIQTGAERPGFPVTIAGAADNDPAVVFEPVRVMQRPGLLYLHGAVYAAFGGICDRSPYAGWIVGVAPDGRIVARWTTEAAPLGTDEGGIWQSGGGLASDGPDQILFASANDSTRLSPTPGSSPPSSLGNSLVRLRVGATGALAATDFFRPADSLLASLSDLDFGAAGPVVLPPVFGTASFPRLVIAGDKQGYLYVLDRDHLGGHRQASAGDNDILTRLATGGKIRTRFAVWPGDGGYVYAMISDRGDDQTTRLVALHAATGAAVPHLLPAITPLDVQLYGSGSPVVTSDGETSGTALVWSTFAPVDGSPGRLRAYDAVPESTFGLTVRFDAVVGPPAKFAPPGVGAGRIYVGTADGHVIGFGRIDR